MDRHEGSRPPRSKASPQVAKSTEQGSSAPEARQRIAKAIARAGLCSRREAESWIEQGRVDLNGTVCLSPATDVRASDVVLVDGVPLREPEKTRLFVFHKPRGLITSDHDPEGRPTVTGFLKENWPEGPRVVTVGRLDINTEGLLLLTNDGGLARVLELPQTGWVRRYRVRAKGATDQAKLDALAAGITIDGVDYAGIEAKLDRVQGSNCWLTMGLREGKNREVKRVLEHLGLEVNRLIRLSFGPFQLLDLEEGAVHEVPSRILRDQLGETLAAKAGVIFEAAGEPPRPRESAVRPRTRPPTEPGDRHREGASSRPPQRAGTRQRTDREQDARPRLGRPTAGTRKHISALRAESTKREPASPRKRVDRSDTLDNRNRTVKVERLVRPDRKEDRVESPRRPSSDGDERRRVRKPPSGSPSALGKRERIARSGARAAVERQDRSAESTRPDTRPDKRPDKRAETRGRPSRTRPERPDARSKQAAASPKPRAGAPAPKLGAKRHGPDNERRADRDRPKPRSPTRPPNRAPGRSTKRPKPSH